MNKKRVNRQAHSAAKKKVTLDKQPTTKGDASYPGTPDLLRKSLAVQRIHEKAVAQQQKIKESQKVPWSIKDIEIDKLKDKFRGLDRFKQGSIGPPTTDGNPFSPALTQYAKQKHTRLVNNAKVYDKILVGIKPIAQKRDKSMGVHLSIGGREEDF